jgi:23S rRNA (adenine2503-C2)-methyltransferase
MSSSGSAIVASESAEAGCYHPEVGPPNLFGMGKDELQAVVGELGEPAYRARQLYGWLYSRRVGAVAAMVNLPRPMQRTLAERYRVRWPEVHERTLSFDGTRKYLFRLDDGATVEAVYIPEDDRRTICVSTQAGCPLRCAFCLTGLAGYRRNLKPGEILGQVATVMQEHPASLTHPRRREADPFPWNVVMMGMGEPLLNYEATVAALRILMDKDGFAVPPRKLTLSTVGILPALERLAQEPVRPNLAISLHAPDPVLRRALMPIEDRYALSEVVAAALRYPIPRGGRVTFEYVLLGGVNDSLGHARELARRLGGTAAKVNLIPLNPAPEIPFNRPTPEAVEAFAEALAEASVSVTVRRPRGLDILAACGQLHLREGAAAVPTRH